MFYNMYVIYDNIKFLFIIKLNKLNIQLEIYCLGDKSRERSTKRYKMHVILLTFSPEF